MMPVGEEVGQGAAATWGGEEPGCLLAGPPPSGAPRTLRSSTAGCSSSVPALGLNASCSEPLLPLLPSPEADVACRWRHCIHCCAPFARDPRPSVVCIQPPLFEMPSGTSFNNWTLTRTWLFRKNISEVFLESVIVMCKVATGWLLIKGTRSSNRLTFPCVFLRTTYTNRTQAHARPVCHPGCNHTQL